MEVQQNKGYDFPVSRRQLFTQEGIEVKKARAVFRDDTNEPISVVTDQYNVFEHKEALKHIEPFIKVFGEPTFNYHLEKNGARGLFDYTFKNQQIQVGGAKVNDMVVMKLTAINSYDLSTSLTIKMCAIVLRCLNGQTIPRGELDLHFRHTKNIWEISLPDPQIVLDAYTSQGRVWNSYSDMDIKTEKVDEMVEQAFSWNVISKRAFNEHIEMFSKVNTFWDLYNAFTFVLTHKSPKVMYSRRLQRFDRLNSLFNYYTKPEKDVTPTTSVLAI